MTKILTVVISCFKHRYLWKHILSYHPKDTIIVCGAPRLPGYYYFKDNILLVKTKDDYEGLPQKMIGLFSVILLEKSFHEYTHILKVDDHDTLFTEETIKNLEKNSALQKYDYIGQVLEPKLTTGIMLNHIGRTSKNSYWSNRTFQGRSIPFLHGGASYILSKKALKAIFSQYNFKNQYLISRKYTLEDHMVADLLFNYNIHPFVMNYGVRCEVKNPYNI